MGDTVPTDLKISRKHSGLSNGDLAHLLGVSTTRVSQLQNGSARITIKEMCLLCMIYGRAPYRLFRLTNGALIEPLRKRLAEMPQEPNNWERLRQNRQETLNTLHGTLHKLSPQKDAG